jgi:putative membrane protein
MLWLKAFHIIFVVTWFAGLFYLPRLFIYHLEASDPRELARFVTMERRLLAITHIGAALTLAFGVAVLVWWVQHAPDYFKQGWLHAKLALVVALIGYHGWCVKIARDFAAGRNTKTDRWLRVFNELPALALIGIVLLVVLKPF